ncbi:hypothetical protein OPU71_17070 [Niveibacterium sp. 24ML]|uniref:hypothetical protein n=1 Tax=Niveibacterium sp. 24ML TaxID=2985512 RepID=UPI002271667C|nr:hypothetical protein [Niveibacterium sp. 24ML]MCX9157838.1 hypothetical protein [Niveibacterium sp. 24ML]
MPGLAIDAAQLEAPPYSFVRKNEPAGAYVDVVRVIAAASGLAINIRSPPSHGPSQMLPQAAQVQLNRAVDMLRQRGDIARILHRWGEQAATSRLPGS